MKNEILTEYIPWKVVRDLSYLGIKLSAHAENYWDIASICEGVRIGNGGIYGPDVSTKCFGITKSKTCYPAYTYEDIVRWINDRCRYIAQHPSSKIKITTFNTRIERTRDLFLLFIFDKKDSEMLRNLEFPGVGLAKRDFYRELIKKHMFTCDVIWC